MTSEIFTCLYASLLGMAENEFDLGVTDINILEFGARISDGQEKYNVKKLVTAIGYKHFGVDKLPGENVDFQYDIENAMVHTEVIQAMEQKMYDSVNIILCMETLEHIYDYKRFLTALRCYPKGTIIIISVPDFGFAYHGNALYMDYHRFSVDTLQAMFVSFDTIAYRLLTEESTGYKTHFAIVKVRG